MRITAGSRFVAHERLNIAHKWSLTTISILSFYVIAVGILLAIPAAQDVLAISGTQQSLVVAISLGLGVAILALSALEASQGYQLRADVAHRCGRDISDLLNRFDKRLALSTSDGQIGELVDQISDEYSAILNRYQENHSAVDFDLYRAQKRGEFGIPLRSAMWARVKFVTMVYGGYWVVIMAPVGLFLALLAS